MKGNNNAFEGEPREISNLELVEWVTEDHSMRSISQRDGVPIDQRYRNFADALTAIRDKGEIVIATPFADLLIFEPTGKYEGCLIAVRVSGINVRRFLIRESSFDEKFLSFDNCIDHLLSNNTYESELELQHLRDLGSSIKRKEIEVSDDPINSRLKIDLVAANQLLKVYEESFDSSDIDTHFIFEIGFSIGRIFSSIQNLATLEEKANKASRYEESYKERGKKGKSGTRKRARLIQLISFMEKLLAENPAFVRLDPFTLGKLAMQDAANEDPALWTQGQGQLEAYLTALASDPAFKARYNLLFFKTA